MEVHRVPPLRVITIDSDKGNLHLDIQILFVFQVFELYLLVTSMHNVRRYVLLKLVYFFKILLVYNPFLYRYS